MSDSGSAAGRYLPKIVMSELYIYSGSLVTLGGQAIPVSVLPTISSGPHQPAMRYAEIALRPGPPLLAALAQGMPSGRGARRGGSGGVPGRLAQRESASFTPRRSLVRSQYRPPLSARSGVGLQPRRCQGSGQQAGRSTRDVSGGSASARVSTSEQDCFRRSVAAGFARPRVPLGNPGSACYAFEFLIACAYSRPLYQPHEEHAVCGRTASRHRGQVVSVGGFVFH